MTIDELGAMGFYIRVFDAQDTAFIVSSWRRSGESKFLQGTYQPFERLAETIRVAFKQNNFTLVKKIFHSEIGLLINRVLKEGRIIVVADRVAPNIIIGYGCKEWQYLKQAFRGVGIEEIMEKIIHGG